MKLHLMASFRTHFRLRDEEINVSPKDYASFWGQVSDSMDQQDAGSVDSGKEFSCVKFLHRYDVRGSESSRFRSVEIDSLFRPLHVLEFTISSSNTLLTATWDEVIAAFPQSQRVLANVSPVLESATVRIYNNSIAFLQIDLDISDVIRATDAESIASLLDTLQEVAIKFGEELARAVYRNNIKPYLAQVIEKVADAPRYIALEYFDYENAVAKSILTQESTPDSQSVKVNWVTRTLLVEHANETNLSVIIEHWLKDSGHQASIDRVQQNDQACAIRWLNYLFRENAYAWQQNDDGTINYGLPFSDEWQAMLNAQYYYAAFESLNDTLKSTLSHAYLRKNRSGHKVLGALTELNRVLERDIITANLTLLEYHNNYGYYKRKVGVTMKEIMDGWDFDEAILTQVERNTGLCKQRISELNQKAASRSSFYSDILLLGIAVTSIVAFLFQVIEYGRNISLNADLAVYESNTWNLVEFISEQPTDFIIMLSLALIILLFVLYAWFRRATVMD